MTRRADRAARAAAAPRRRTVSRTLLLAIWGLLLTAVLGAALRAIGEEDAGSRAAQVAHGGAAKQ
jgi:hypothetical protein